MIRSHVFTLVLSFLVLARVAPAEIPDPTMEALRARQAQQEEQRIANELENPVPVDLPAERAVKGPKKAPITIVVYSDFQCPYCSKGAETVEEVVKKYGKKIRYAFKHLPLSFHPMAMPAAKYFEAIAMQSPVKAYQYHDEVFQHQSRLSEGVPYLDEVAKKLKVNEKKLKADIESETVTKRLAADAEEARKAGITGTPGFNVAGVVLKGAYPIEAFSLIIDKKLAKRSTASKTN